MELVPTTDRLERELVRVANPAVQRILDGYANRPPIYVWDHPKISVWDAEADKVKVMGMPQMRAGHGPLPDELVRVYGGPPDWPALWYRIVFHELVHSTGAPWRLNRHCKVTRAEADLMDTLPPPVIAARGLMPPVVVHEECVADIGAAILLKQTGLWGPWVQHVAEHHMRMYDRVGTVHRGALPDAVRAVEYMTGKPVRLAGP